MLFSLLIATFAGWSQSGSSPNISVTGDQFYCSQTKLNVVTDFNFTDGTKTDLDAFYIQISKGYIQGQDRLELGGIHPSITTQWSTIEGKLTLKGIGNNPILINDLIAAVKDVSFESASTTFVGKKNISYTIGSANYLPLTDHYYEFVPSVGITWSTAKQQAENRTYYGLQGYLATITSQTEATFAGEQANGAGWIGGSDASSEGVWKWVTGPENGTTFWNGLANGSSPSGQFAFWNTGEPNQAGDEDYAHITAPNIGRRGSWNDLSNTGASSGDYQPKGYIVEYGGMPGDPTINISASSKITVSKINSTLGDEICGPGKLTLSATASSGIINWYASETSPTILGSGESFTTPLINTTTTFYVSTNDCASINRIPVEAVIHELPVAPLNMELKNCDEDGIPDGITIFNLDQAAEFITNGNSSLTVSFYTNENDAINNPNSTAPFPYNNSTSNSVFFRLENEFGCFDIGTIELKVSTTSFPDGYIDVLPVCDDDIDGTNDGINTFDLTLASERFKSKFPAGQNLSVQYYRNLEDAQLEQNKITDQTDYVNEKPFSQILYVRVESEDNGDCFGIGPHLELLVRPQPEFEVSETEIYCSNLPPITLYSDNALGNYEYEWFDESGNLIGSESSVTVSSAGEYSLIATSEFGCASIPKTTTVIESSVANFGIENITITDNSENNAIRIDPNNLGPGNYEFSINNPYDTFQDEPFFENIAPGIHTVYVRDKNECGTAQLQVAVLGFPRFFTPNNDGYNDYWQIQGFNNQFSQISPIQLFNRFGKLVASIDPNSQGWNGTFNGELLPSTEYWYSFQVIDNNGISRSLKGHFSLIRK